MSTTVEVALTKYPSLERVHAPLLAAVTLLERLLLTAGDAAGGQDVLAQAKTSLARLETLVPPLQEVLDDFLDGFGPLEAKFGRAQNDAWREGRHDPTITDSLCNETLRQVQELFNSISPTADIAHVAYRHVHAETPLLRQALDEAQADGWQRGDSCSQVRDDLVERFMHVVTTAARGITHPNT